MRMPIRPLAPAFRSAALLVLAVGLTAGGEGDPLPDGLPDIQGTWVGTVSYAFFPFDPAEDKQKATIPATLVVVQDGPMLTADLDVISQEGPQHWDLVGTIGNGNFWLQFADPNEPLLLSGHVKGKAPKLKGKGVLAGGAESNELKFKFAPGVLALTPGPAAR